MITSWTSHVEGSKVDGAPDGTGLRFCHLMDSPTLMPHLSLWLSALGRHFRNPFMIWWLLARTIGGQCKKDEHGDYPELAKFIKSIRPLARMCIFRRLLAKELAPLVCKAVRPLVEPYGQYGLSPDGCPATYRSARSYTPTSTPLPRMHR